MVAIVETCEQIRTTALLVALVLLALSSGCLGGDEENELVTIYATPALILDEVELILEPGRHVEISGVVAPIVDETCVVNLTSTETSLGLDSEVQTDGRFSIAVDGLIEAAEIMVLVKCSRTGDLESQTVLCIVYSNDSVTQTNGLDRLGEALIFINWVDEIDEGIFTPPSVSGSATFQSESISFQVSWTSNPARVNWSWDISDVGAFERIAVGDERSTKITRIDDGDALRNLTKHPASLDIDLSYVESIRNTCGNRTLAETELLHPWGCEKNAGNLSLTVTVSGMIEGLQNDEAVLTMIPTSDRTRYRTEGVGVVLDIVHHADETVDGIVLWRQGGVQTARLTISLGEGQTLSIPEDSIRAAFDSKRGNLSADNATNWTLPLNITSNVTLQRIMIEVHRPHPMTDWSLEVLARIALGMNGQGENGGWSAVYGAAQRIGGGWDGTLLLTGPMGAPDRIRILITDTWSGTSGWGEPDVNRSGNKTFERVVEGNQMVGAEIDLFIEEGVELCWRWTSPKNGTGDLHTHIGDEKPSYLAFDGAIGQRCWTANETLPLSIIFRPNSVGVDVYLEVWGEVQEMFL